MCQQVVGDGQVVKGKVVRVFDVPPASERDWRGRTVLSHGLAVSSAHMAVAQSSGHIAVYELPAGTHVRTFAVECSPRKICFSKHDTLLVALSETAQNRVVEITLKGKQVRCIATVDCDIWGISANDDYIAVGRYNDELTRRGVLLFHADSGARMSVDVAGFGKFVFGLHMTTFKSKPCLYVLHGERQRQYGLTAVSPDTAGVMSAPRWLSHVNGNVKIGTDVLVAGEEALVCDGAGGIVTVFRVVDCRVVTMHVGEGYLTYPAAIASSGGQYYVLDRDQHRVLQFV